MNRLTTKNGLYKISDNIGIGGTIVGGSVCAESFNELSRRFEKVLKKLAKYEDLEEQGLLIKLPCKVGDSVYFITQELDIVRGALSKVIDEYIVTEIRGNKYNPLWYMSSSERCVHRDFHPTEIGKTVFLTREEAEKALEKK